MKAYDWYHSIFLFWNTNFGVLLNPYASWMNKVDPCYFGSCLIMIIEQEKQSIFGIKWCKWQNIREHLKNRRNDQSTAISLTPWQRYTSYLHSLNIMGTVVLSYHMIFQQIELRKRQVIHTSILFFVNINTSYHINMVLPSVE